MARYRITWGIDDDMGGNTLTFDAASKKEAWRRYADHPLGEIWIPSELEDEPKMRGSVKLHMQIDDVEELDG